jgi:hypothetical protein
MYFISTILILILIIVLDPKMIKHKIYTRIDMASFCDTSLVQSLLFII